MSGRPFPPGFMLGCATSAYQIEGGIENDWAAWARAGKLKEPAARCGLATDHWQRWQTDLELLTSLGAGGYRFSVEWARIEPTPGQYDEAALDRYVAILDGLRERNIEPFVTLLHFTHPPWFHDSTPWHEPDAPERFAAFVDHVGRRFGERARFYTVINEPAVWLAGAYFKGLIPPGISSVRKLAQATANLVRAHGRAAAALRAAQSNVQIGIAKHFMRFQPGRGRLPWDRVAAGYVAHHFNHVFVRALETGHLRLGAIPGIRVDYDIPEAKGTLDFLGINYYSRVFAEVRARVSPEALDFYYEDRSGNGVTDLGWEIFPQGLTDALVEMNQYRRPIYITENGLDDRSGTRRAAFIHAHLHAVLDAIEQGADVRGYLHWSLLDNFEWLEAFGPRFGLYRVDYDTFERTPTAGAEFYQRVISARAVPHEAPPQEKRPGNGRVRPG